MQNNEILAVEAGLVMFERGEGAERLGIAVSEHGRGSAGMVESVLKWLPTGLSVQTREPLLVRNDPVRSHWSARQPQWVGAHLASRVLKVPGSHVQLVHVRKLMIGPSSVVSVWLGVVRVRLRVMKVSQGMVLSPGQNLPCTLIH